MRTDGGAVHDGSVTAIGAEAPADCPAESYTVSRTTYPPGCAHAWVALAPSTTGVPSPNVHSYVYAGSGWLPAAVASVEVFTTTDLGRLMVAKGGSAGAA